MAERTAEDWAQWCEDWCGDPEEGFEFAKDFPGSKKEFDDLASFLRSMTTHLSLAEEQFRADQATLREHRRLARDALAGVGPEKVMSPAVMHEALRKIAGEE